MGESDFTKEEKEEDPKCPLLNGTKNIYVTGNTVPHTCHILRKSLFLASLTPTSLQVTT